MKKKVLFRSLFGLLSGVALGQLIAIVISAIKGDGSFYAVIPELVNDFGRGTIRSYRTDDLARCVWRDCRRGFGDMGA